MATAIKHTFRIALCLQLLRDVHSVLAVPADESMKRTIATWQIPRIPHPRSIVPNDRPKAESASNRAALPFVAVSVRPRASLLAPHAHF